MPDVSTNLEYYFNPTIVARLSFFKGMLLTIIVLTIYCQSLVLLSIIIQFYFISLLCLFLYEINYFHFNLDISVSNTYCVGGV